QFRTNFQRFQTPIHPSIMQRPRDGKEIFKSPPDYYALTERLSQQPLIISGLFPNLQLKLDDVMSC
ncbi:MAG: hypothetical protein ACKPCP_29385, partial [Sphaerospermopsis kisseleviana]